MPKKKAKKKFPSKKIAALAGIFAAGSFVGANFDISLMNIPSGTDLSIDSLFSTETTAKDETAAPETSVTLSTETGPVTVPEKPYVPETPAVPSPQPAPEPDVKPEPDVQTPPQVQESTQEPSAGDRTESDWMEGIFVPSQPSGSTVPEDSGSYEDWGEWEPVPPAPPAGDPSAPVQDWMEPTVTAPAPQPDRETSSMTGELAGMLEGIAVFWAPSGTKIHLDPACRSFDNGVPRYTGTLEEAQTVRTGGWCRWCAEHLDGAENSVFYVKGNVYAVSDVLTGSYTYSDYLNKIPASAFGN